MDSTIIAAKALGLYLIISGLFLMFRGKTVPNLLKDFFGHPAVVYLTGMILVFLSVLFLIQNNTWDGTWHTLITVLVWAVFLKGLAYVFAPNALHRMITRKFLGSLSVYGLVTLAAGVFLLYLA